MLCPIAAPSQCRSAPRASSPAWHILTSSRRCGTTAEYRYRHNLGRQARDPALWQHRHECEAFIDGVSVGRRQGGTVAFNFDVTTYVTAGIPSASSCTYVTSALRRTSDPGGANGALPIDPTAASTPVPRGSGRRSGWKPSTWGPGLKTCESFRTSTMPACRRADVLRNGVDASSAQRSLPRTRSSISERLRAATAYTLRVAHCRSAALVAQKILPLRPGLRGHRGWECRRYGQELCRPAQSPHRGTARPQQQALLPAPGSWTRGSTPTASGQHPQMKH